MDERGYKKCPVKQIELSEIPCQKLLPWNFRDSILLIGCMNLVSTFLYVLQECSLNIVLIIFIACRSHSHRPIW